MILLKIDIIIAELRIHKMSIIEIIYSPLKLDDCEKILELLNTNPSILKLHPDKCIIIREECIKLLNAFPDNNTLYTILNICDLQLQKNI